MITNIEEAKEFLLGQSFTFAWYTEHTFHFVSTAINDYYAVIRLNYSTNTVFSAYIENDMFFEEENVSELEIYHKEKLMYQWQNPEH